MNHPESKSRVFIVDDHPIVRRGLSKLLNDEPDFSVCGEAENASTALSAIEALNPDLVTTDITMPGCDGIELIRCIASRWPKLPILVLSMHDESLYPERALRAGAKGYVMKREVTEKLANALRRILKGQIYLSEKLSHQIMRKAVGEKYTQGASPVAALSERELEILKLVGQGHGTRQIAKDLNLSVKTVESHRAHIKDKLSLKTAPEMLRFAVQWSNAGATEFEPLQPA